MPDSNFAASYLQALAGGLLIGLSAGLYLLLNGRIAGISGLAASAFGWSGPDGFSPLGLGFVAGLVGGAGLAIGFLHPPEIVVSGAPLLLVAAGLLVGYGTRLGSGCTSGHGVCGLARLSPRSMVATALFMVVAAVTVFVTRHWIGAV